LHRTIELVAKFQFSEMLPTLQIESITIAELKVASEPGALLGPGWSALKTTRLTQPQHQRTAQ
jgi:hypothetical protein